MLRSRRSYDQFMDRSLLRITAFSGLACLALIFISFFFIDQPVDWIALDLRNTILFHAAAYLSLIADHNVFSVLLFAAYVYIGLQALLRGMTPGLHLALYCCLAVTIAMLMGETLKWFFGRYRPELLFDQGLYGFSFFSDKGSRHSFPSGHTFRIFSAMTALSLVWPKARPWLISLACLVGISRVLVTRHYPSDVLAGAFLGIYCALWVWRIMQGMSKSLDSNAPVRMS